MSATRTPTLAAAADSSARRRSFLAFPARSGAHGADPPVLSSRSEAVLFLPPDAPPSLLLPLQPLPPSPQNQDASISPPARSAPSQAPALTPQPPPPLAPPPPSGPADTSPSSPDANLNLDANSPGRDAAASSGDDKSNSTSSSSPPPLVMAYYPDWAGDDFPPEKVDFRRFDWIDFAFAVPDPQFNLSWDGSDDAPDLLKRLVSNAHSAGKHVKLSVGGWTGSRYVHSFDERRLVWICIALVVHHAACTLAICA